MTKQTYVQCTMERKTSTVTVTTTSWIPAKFAKMGRVLDLKEGDTWSRDWVVKSVGFKTDKVPDWRKTIRGHRKMTGDSLPRRGEGASGI